MERCIMGSIIPRNSNNSKERAWVIDYYFLVGVRCRAGAKMLTLRPAPRWPILVGSRLFSMNAIPQQSES
jgi:hypothetical protein